jgi:hypothetical protein
MQPSIETSYVSGRLAWLVGYLEQPLHDLSELRQAGRTVE